MALTLDATPGGVASNAYATVAAAITAAQYRVGANPAAWLALTPDQQIQSLVTGASELDSLDGLRLGDWVVGFPGEKTNANQAMQWPRGGTLVLPANLVEANIEMAFSYAPAFAPGYAGPDVVNGDPTSARVKRKKVDVLETEYFEGGPVGTALEQFPGMVQRLMAPLLEWSQIAGLLWGEGTVIRGS